MTTILRLPADPAELTLPALLLRNAEDHGDLPALSWRTGESWSTLTWSEVRREAAALAAGYAALGVGRGDHVLMYLVALLVPDATARTDPAALREGIAQAVEQANARLSRPERIKRYRILDEEWSPETGELTPSLKLRRRAIRDRYARVLDELHTD